MKNHFEEFFVCPECKETVSRYRKSEFKKYMEDSPSYCLRCGRNVANALSEALASLEEDS